MGELIFYKSPWKAIRLILISLPFILFCSYNIINHKNSEGLSMQWFGLCFFGLGIPIGVFNLLDRRPEIIINNEGIFNRMTYGTFNKSDSKGIVKWDMIEDAYLKVNQGRYRGLPLSKQKTICLVYNENTKTALNNKTSGKLSHAMGYADYNIILMHLKKLDEQKLLNFIKAMIHADSATKQKLLLSYEP